MAAYRPFDNLELTDRVKLEEYKIRVAPVVEGSWKPTFPLVIESPSLDRARQWYYSEEYRELNERRHQAVRCNAVFLDGVQVAPVA